MTTRSMTVAAIAMVLWTTPAPAQHDRPEAIDEDIVVTGRSADDRRQAARDFVRDVSPPPIDGQFARWQVPLCPAVRGVSTSIARQVSDRVRAAARRTGAPVAGDDCRPNAIIVFTPDARGLLTTMERRQPRLLADMPLADRRAMRTIDRPVLWWTGTQGEGADGNPLTSNSSVALGFGAGASIPASDRTRFGDSYRSSIVSTGFRVAIDSAVVLVDVPRSTGYRLDAIADYAAFVILARARPAIPRVGTPTILRLFADSAEDRPTGLTPADTRYLSSLYAIAPDRAARSQAALIARTVARPSDPQD